MTEEAVKSVAIVDYGLGNLFSIKHACAQAGMRAEITSEPREILAADAVVLPGMGAFGDAMEALRRLDLIEVLRDAAAGERPLIGVCLGLQLLMSEGHEFGRHAGLGIIPGMVVRFDDVRDGETPLKVPQIGWNRILKPVRASGAEQAKLANGGISQNGEGAAMALDPWADSPLAGLSDGEFMYFVHSYYAVPEDRAVVLSTSRYGATEFCSSIKYRNIYAFQFHPERSGPAGISIYRNVAALIGAESETAKGETVNG
jgi:glutamine amidotransferase